MVRVRRVATELTKLKLVRYSAASAAGVVVGQLTILGCYQLLHWPGIPANLASVTLGAIPNYTINRYWTWHQTGKNRLWGEIVPFWTMGALGALLSTLAVAYADRQFGTGAAVAAANLVGFGVLWIAKFFVLDKLMWRVVREIQPDVDVDEAGSGLIGALHLDETNFEPHVDVGVPTTRPSDNGATGEETAGEGAARPAASRRRR